MSLIGPTPLGGLPSDDSPQSLLPAGDPCNIMVNLKTFLRGLFVVLVTRTCYFPPAAIFEIAARASAISGRSEVAAFFSSVE